MPCGAASPPGWFVMFVKFALANKALGLAAAGALTTATTAAAVTGVVPLPTNQPDNGVETALVELTTTTVPDTLPSNDTTLEDPPPVQFVPIEEFLPVTTTVAEPVETTFPIVDETAEVEDDEACDAAEHHGEYVSGVAHRDHGDDENHGDAVREAAHSDCGKVSGSDGSSEDHDANHSDDSDADHSDADHSDADHSDDDDADHSDADHSDDDDSDADHFDDDVERRGTGHGDDRDDDSGHGKGKNNHGDDD